MDFETTALNGSQLLHQLKSTLAQYDPDYAEESLRYEQAKRSLPDSTYPDALEAQFAAKLLYIAYQGFCWNLDCFQHPVNKLRLKTDYEDLHKEQQLSYLPEVIRMEKSIHAIYESFSPDQREAAEYSNIGINKMDSMLRSPNCPFVLFVGTKKLVKRKEFEQYISEHTIL